MSSMIEHGYIEGRRTNTCGIMYCSTVEQGWKWVLAKGPKAALRATRQRRNILVSKAWREMVGANYVHDAIRGENV